MGIDRLQRKIRKIRRRFGQPVQICLGLLEKDPTEREELGRLVRFSFVGALSCTVCDKTGNFAGWLPIALGCPLFGGGSRRGSAAAGATARAHTGTLD